MRTHDIPSYLRKSGGGGGGGGTIMPPDLALSLTLSGSNYSSLDYYRTTPVSNIFSGFQRCSSH